MTTKLEGPLKREVEIDGSAYTLTITPQGLTLALKGRRKGFDLDWQALVNGDAALATALNASLGAPAGRPSASPQRSSAPVKKKKR
jgi:hypothetical protein